MTGDVDGGNDLVVAVSNRRGQANGALTALGGADKNAGFKDLLDISAQGIRSLGLVVCECCRCRFFDNAFLVLRGLVGEQDLPTPESERKNLADGEFVAQRIWGFDAGDKNSMVAGWYENGRGQRRD